MLTHGNGGAQVEDPGTAVDEGTAVDPVSNCQAMARSLVGQIGVRAALELLRTAMYEQALSVSGGSRRAAARLLKVDRRCVQRVAADADSQAADTTA